MCDDCQMRTCLPCANTLHTLSFSCKHMRACAHTHTHTDRSMQTWYFHTIWNTINCLQHSTYIHTCIMETPVLTLDETASILAAKRKKFSDSFFFRTAFSAYILAPSTFLCWRACIKQTDNKETNNSKRKYSNNPYQHTRRLCSCLPYIINHSKRFGYFTLPYNRMLVQLLGLS